MKAALGDANSRCKPSIQADHVGAGSEPARTSACYAWLESARTPIYYAWLEPAPTATCYAWLEPASTPAYAFVRCANKTLPSIWAGSNRDCYRHQFPPIRAVHVGAGSEPARTPICYAWLEPARTPTHTPNHTPANGQRNYVPK